MRCCLLVVLAFPSFVIAQQPGSLDDHAAKIAALKQSLQALKVASDAMKIAQADVDAKLAAFLGSSPGPKPPGPGPAPVDPLLAKLKDAFATDKGLVADAKQLGSLYELAAKLAADKTVPSSNELLRRVRDAGSSLIGADALPTLRGVVAVELMAALGAPSDVALTDAQRAAAGALFAKLATVLEGF